MLSSKNYRQIIVIYLCKETGNNDPILSDLATGIENLKRAGEGENEKEGRDEKWERRKSKVGKDSILRSYH